MEPAFIHLRLHTEYSLSDGLLTIPALMEKSASMGMPAITLSDQGNLYAMVKFYQTALYSGLKPIIGVDIQVAHATPTQPPARLTLLCQNQEGYKNLLKLISKSFLEGQTLDGQPLVQRAWLQTLSHGLIALSGREGDAGQALFAQDPDTARQALCDWQALFPQRFYIEISRVGKPQENEYLHGILKLAESLQIPVVATNDVRFLEKEDFEAHEARVCIQEGFTLNDPNRPRRYTDQQYLRSPEEMQALFADIPSALTNTVEIAKRCNVTFTLGQK